MKRIHWIDHLKALGIFLAVYGHSLSVWWGLEIWMRSFRIPLFFLVSGYLIKKPIENSRFREVFRRQAYGLAPPYLIFATIGYIFWFSIERRFGVDTELDVSPTLTFLTIFYGTGTPSFIHLQPLVLWFFPCLFLSQLFVLSVSKLDHLKIAITSIFIASIGFLLPQGIALPFELETALVAQIFVTLGFLAKEKRWIENIAKWKLGPGFIMLFTGVALALLNGKIDMRSSSYENPLLFLSGAIMTTLGLAVFFSKVGSLRISSLLSSNSVIIFPLHTLIFSFIVGVYIHIFNWDLKEINNPVLGLISSIANCAIILVFIVPIFKKWLPAAYGIKLNKAA